MAAQTAPYPGNNQSGGRLWFSNGENPFLTGKNENFPKLNERKTAASQDDLFPAPLWRDDDSNADADFAQAQVMANYVLLARNMPHIFWLVCLSFRNPKRATCTI
jgi:hypothetical protein